MGVPDAALERLRKLGRCDLGDFLRVEVAVDPRHPKLDADGLVYEARRYRVQALRARRTWGRPFGVDVAFAGPRIGEPETLQVEPWLDFVGLAPTRVYAFTLPHPRPSARAKDLPDIALCARTRPLTAPALRDALVATCGGRGTHEPPATLPDPPDLWAALLPRDGVSPGGAGVGEDCWRRGYVAEQATRVTWDYSHSRPRR